MRMCEKYFKVIFRLLFHYPKLLSNFSHETFPETLNTVLQYEEGLITSLKSLEFHSSALTYHKYSHRKSDHIKIFKWELAV
jgi:hypothetical protein